MLWCTLAQLPGNVCLGLKSREDFDLAFALEANYFLSSGCLCSVFHCCPPGSSLLLGFVGYWLCASVCPDLRHPYFCWAVLHTQSSQSQGNLTGPTGAGAGLAPRLLLSVSPGCVRSVLPSMQGATIGTCSINSCASLWSWLIVELTKGHMRYHTVNCYTDSLKYRNHSIWL